MTSKPLPALPPPWRSSPFWLQVMLLIGSPTTVTPLKDFPGLKLKPREPKNSELISRLDWSARFTVPFTPCEKVAVSQGGVLDGDVPLKVSPSSNVSALASQANNNEAAPRMTAPFLILMSFVPSPELYRGK